MKNQMNRTLPDHGFSLVELAIVLVIIAVIIAGILVGRTMLLSADLQTVMTDEASYQSAIGQFKTAYNALPGDYNGATAQWGTDSSGCPNGGGATGTCDGNSDGKVGPACTSGTMDVSHGNESFRAWQHLYSAGLITKKLSGSGDVTYTTFAVGTNLPATAIKGAGFNLMWVDDPSLCSNYWGLIPSTGQYGNSLVLGTNTTPYILSPNQAEEVDRKMDDGLPATGQVRAPVGAGTYPCAINSSGYIYNNTRTARVCGLIFLTGY